MHGIKVFLASSTKADAQNARNNIRLLLSRLQNRRWGPYDKQTALYVHDYKDFRSNQKEYDAFIQNDADLFIALVDAKFDGENITENEDGKGTFAEFKLACESFLKKGKPEVILLYKTFVLKQTHKKTTYKMPSKKWMELLERIDKYAISNTKYSLLNEQLITEVESTIRKFIPDTPTTVTTNYKIGDYYEKDGVQGIVFSVNKTGKSGKILSIKPSFFCSWKDFSRKKHPFIEPWRVPDIDEIEEIFTQYDTYNKIDKTLRSLKGATNLEHDRYKDSYLSCTTHKAFRQKIVKWSHSSQKFSLSDCETSHFGIIRPVADVEF